MRTRITLAALGALTLGACTDRHDATTAPALTVDLARNSAEHNPTGAVYVQTNGATGNEVIVFHRAANGTLQPPKTFATGGRGTGMPRLGSQGSVLLGDGGRWLFVANVGSDEISVFEVTSAGLRLASKIGSGGTAPYSFALRGNLLYVLNEGSSTAGAPANITAFTVGDDGTLVPLAGSTRPLSTSYPAPAQVSFSPDGAKLVVTEKATSIIDTYAVGSSGLATGPMVHPSHGETPFGFAFRSDGIFVVTEAHNARPGEAAASSYSVAGGFQLLSGSVRDTQTDVCWTVISKDGRYAYITNFGSGTLSSYTIAADGHIRLLQAVAGRTAEAQGPRDEQLSNDGRYLYVVDVGFASHATQAVNAFAVHSDGSLTKVGAYELPHFYPALAGLAAR